MKSLSLRLFIAQIICIIVINAPLPLKASADASNESETSLARVFSCSGGPYSIEVREFSGKTVVFDRFRGERFSSHAVVRNGIASLEHAIPSPDLNENFAIGSFPIDVTTTLLHQGEVTVEHTYQRSTGEKRDTGNGTEYPIYEDVMETVTESTQLRCQSAPSLYVDSHGLVPEAPRCHHDCDY